jgi:hypothetical protein
MSETAFKKGGCCELRNDRTLMMWLLGSTDVKILTRTRSVHTWGLAWRRAAAVDDDQCLTYMAKQDVEWNLSAAAALPDRQLSYSRHDSINIPYTHRSSWFGKRRSKNNISGIRLNACINILSAKFCWLISSPTLETGYLVSGILGFPQSLQSCSKLGP